METATTVGRTVRRLGLYRVIFALSWAWTTPLYAQELDYGGSTYKNTAGRAVVDCARFVSSPDVAVVMTFGQSNAANEADPDGLFTPQSGVYNYNLLDGKCYIAKDPLLGATQNRSNFSSRLGDLLVRRGTYKAVLLVPVAAGGSFATDWAPGGVWYPRAEAAVRQLKSIGLRVTHALWQQGEAEGQQKGPDPDKYRATFLTMLSRLRDAGLDAPVFVALCTTCHGPPNEIIRAAQRGLASEEAKIHVGADTDTIGLDERYDRCHFSTAGLQKAAELWFQVLASTKH